VSVVPIGPATAPTPAGRLRQLLDQVGLLGPEPSWCVVDARDLAAVLDQLDDLTRPAPPAMGRPPYGWRSGRGELVPALDELQQLRLAVSYRAAGRRKWREVADRLNAAGLTAREGRPWSAAGIARAVARSSVTVQPNPSTREDTPRELLHP
jgi:hypothetical protein